VGSLLAERRTVDTAVTAAIVGAVSGSAISAAATITSQWLNGRERERTNVRLEAERAGVSAADRDERQQAKREEFLFRALEHFGGRTQERSVGIAIAEAYWRSTPEQHDVLVPVLLNQLVYLLAVQDSEKGADAAHERQNVRRIVELLERIDDIDRFRESYEFSLRLSSESEPAAVSIFPPTRRSRGTWIASLATWSSESASSSSGAGRQASQGSHARG
jgi:hypothetical protein